MWLYCFFNLGVSWGCVLNATPRPLYPREREAVPIVQEAGWAQAQIWAGAENLATSGIRTPEPTACSESLCE